MTYVLFSSSEDRTIFISCISLLGLLHESVTDWVDYVTEVCFPIVHVIEFQYQCANRDKSLALHGSFLSCLQSLFSMHL